MIASVLIDNIILQIFAGQPADDHELSRSQVLHWLSSTRDFLVKSKLDGDINKGRQLDTYYFERVECNVAEEDTLATVDQANEDLFITLPKVPMSLSKDMGIVNVWTEEFVPVLKTRIENFGYFKDLKYSKPTVTNLIYFRIGQKIVIKGINYKNLETDKFIVDYIPSYTSQGLGESDEFKITDDLLPQLYELVEDIARREVFGIVDSSNDGTTPQIQQTLDVDKLKNRD